MTFLGLVIRKRKVNLRLGLAFLPFLMLILMFGCSEAFRATSVVINDSTTVPKAALLSGKTGLQIDVQAVVREMGGEFQTSGKTGGLITLNGKRILVGTTQSQISYDTQIDGWLIWNQNRPFLTKPTMDLVLHAAFGKGNVERKGDKVLLNTNR